MDRNSYKIIGVTALSILFSMQAIFSQTSLVTKRKEIDSIIVSIIGQTNFKKHVTFNKWRSKADKWGNEIKGIPTFESDSVDFIPDYYDLWYDLDLVKGNYLDDVIFVRINIREGIETISIGGIPDSFKNKKDCILIKEKKALSIARQNGLTKGLNKWNSRCDWKKEGGDWIRKDSIQISVEKGYYYWTVTNDLDVTITKSNCKNGYGDCVKINAETGVFMDKKRIQYQCY